MQAEPSVSDANIAHKSSEVVVPASLVEDLMTWLSSSIPQSELKLLLNKFKFSLEKQLELVPPPVGDWWSIQFKNFPGYNSVSKADKY